jgi:hypothetical protein
MAQIESQSQVTLPPLPSKTDKADKMEKREVTLPPLPSLNPTPPSIEGREKALAVVPPAQIMTDKIGLNFTVKTFKPDGTSESITIPLPDSPDFQKWSFAQQVGMLKNGVWKDQSLQDIIFGLAYAKHIGAEVLEGELFPTGNGRWGTSNKYKIKKGFSTGQILAYTVDTVDTGKPLPDTIAAKCIQKTDLECTVTLKVKMFETPLIRRARLSRWFTASNPNWGSRPEHMLELNTLAHAMEFLVPGETDEAPPGLSPLVEGQGSPAREVTVEDLKRQRAQQSQNNKSGGSNVPPPPAPPVVPRIEDGNALPDPTEIEGLLASVGEDK